MHARLVVHRPWKVGRGGAGNDAFYIDGFDTVDGGAGTDFVYLVNDYAMNIDLGSASVEWLRAGFGDDVINAAAQTFDVEVYAAGGNDTITGSGSADFLWAGSGNDSINGETGDDVIIADVGTDTVNGGDGSDGIYADASDLVNGGNGFDAIYITGTATGLSINLATASIEFVADFAGGSDTLDGSSGSANLEIYAAAGNGSISGGTGNDYLWGQAGNDTITGSTGNDVLVGGSGADRLTGGAGIDALYGNGGGGGDGAIDTFVFTSNWGTDFVFDFERGTDKLDLSALGINFAALTLTNTSDGHCYITNGVNLIAVANLGGGLSQAQISYSEPPRRPMARAARIQSPVSRSSMGRASPTR
jgi:serralysin